MARLSIFSSLCDWVGGMIFDTTETWNLFINIFWFKPPQCQISRGLQTEIQTFYSIASSELFPVQIHIDPILYIIQSPSSRLPRMKLEKFIKVLWLLSSHRWLSVIVCLVQCWSGGGTHSNFLPRISPEQTKNVVVGGGAGGTSKD